MMDNNLLYYIFVLRIIVLAIVVIKKVAGCMIKAIALIIAIALILLIYFACLQ